MSEGYDEYDEEDFDRWIEDRLIRGDDGELWVVECWDPIVITPYDVFFESDGDVSPDIGQDGIPF